MSKKLYIGSNLISGVDGKSAYQSWLDQGNFRYDDNTTAFAADATLASMPTFKLLP